MIDDLLDMEKLVAGKMRFDMRWQALPPLLEQAIRHNRAYADRHGARLKLLPHGNDVLVRVDAQRLQQVLANLISNAAKFSPKDSEVTLSTTVDRDMVRISIMDQGPGIPAAFRKRIFEKFARADTTNTRQRGGTGLGLAITRELVERMGGTIGFESTDGKGSVFYFDLPARQISNDPAQCKQTLDSAVHRSF